jgi:hypothetical protein
MSRKVPVRSFRIERQASAPTLEPGDVVVMDNLSAHKPVAVRQAIESAGASILYLRPTAPITTPSSRTSPNSRLSCARPRREPKTRFGTPFEGRLINATPMSSKATSDIAA